MTDNRIPHEEIRIMVDKLENFFNFTEITEYMLRKKYEQLSRLEDVDITKDIFNNFTIQPKDLDITFEEVDGSVISKYVKRLSSHTSTTQIGRQINVGVKENWTDTWLGFIRLSSPIVSIKPRNDYFGVSKLDIYKVNKHIYNGQTIVPVQPFGYNYLGGKLLSLLCVSNEVRNMYNNKYGTDICFFETTSLYGSSKSMSQYDGLDGYIKGKGLTEGTSLLYPTDEVFEYIKGVCRKYYPDFIPKSDKKIPTSPKLNEYNKILKTIKEHLHEYDLEEEKKFKTLIKDRMNCLQQKRFYVSDMGFVNPKEHILNDEPLRYKDYNKYRAVNMIEWWRSKSQRRWENLVERKELKTDLEYYSKKRIEENDLFQIIR